MQCGDCFRNAGLLWLRVLMGAGIATHGYAKIFSGGMTGFTSAVAAMGTPLPELFAWAAALSEFLGGILLALGLATRLAALLVLITMSVAAFVHHAADPFSAKELALAYWVMAGALVLCGPGDLSLDRFLKPPAERSAPAPCCKKEQ
ncbi:MAG: DoxX family protein [Candidatus Omnitrophota bacterium]